MTFKKFFLQVLLNLPEREPRQVEDPAAPPVDSPPAETSVPANPWVDAARGTPETPADAASPGPWELAAGRRSARGWRYTLRTFAVVVLALFAWVGVRTALFPTAPPEPDPLPVALTFDDASAHAIATRFAIAALTWDEDDPQARTETIALDYAGADPTLGWNGRGRQDVLQAIAGAVLVDTDDATRALVTVFAQTVSYTRDNGDSPWHAGAPRWITVEVPVADVDGRMVATAGPAVAGHPAPVEPENPSGHPLEDSALTRETKEIAWAFFEAYGRGDVTALEAPGSNIAAPQAGWTPLELASWRVLDGSGSTRAARAQVIWAPTGEETQTVTHAYDLTLTRVSVGNAERWQVSTIHASR